ncbi:hypothetical protein R1flu_020100 [Riccia fluitans]|uniref:Uncharacterized protein n=1 Tax=Riccia fluitans TaxID=41844 RepID=A0ABD1ZL16_9MARC
MLRIPNSLLASSSFCVCNQEIQIATHRFRPILHTTYSLGGFSRCVIGFHGTKSRSGFASLVTVLSASRFWNFGIQKVGLFHHKTRASNLEAAATILEGDVVEYADSFEDGEVVRNRKERKLGVVLTVDLNSSSGFCDIEPLRQDEPGSNEWVADEDQQQVRVSLSQVRLVEYWPSQRMDSDRVSNPHGEHAHSVWLIDPASLTLE